MTGPSVEQAALAWYEAGCCILPAADDGTKKPGVGSWDRYKTERPDRDQTDMWAISTDGIGMVCGAISGNVEMLELEAAAADLLPVFLAAVSEADPELLAALGAYLERTPTGGYHFLYRVDGPVAGNTKLASRPREPDEASPARRLTLIETRGEGGWTVLAPSAGRTHPTGAPWTILAGEPGVIMTITSSQRDLLHAIAASFDEMPPPGPTPPTSLGQATTAHAPDDPSTPGGDFNNRSTWAEILEPAGWRRIYGRGDMTYWQRPGKNDRTISASTGYQGDWLYVFTTSTEFEPERTYTKFGAYTVLHHSGDHSAAASALRKQGFGRREVPTPPVAERKLTLVPGDATLGGRSSSAVAVPTEALSSMPVTLTDDGNARLLVSALRGQVIYNPERKQWLQWKHNRWVWLASATPVVETMRSVVRSMQPADAAESSHQVRSLGAKHIFDAVKLASYDPAVQIKIDSLDANPFVLNAPNGVIDLRNGTLTEPTPAGRHTKLTGCPIDMDAEPTGWLEFLGQTFQGNVDMINYVQEISGYSATGLITHHILPFLHGPGANGKSVFLEVLMGVLGDYAAPAPIDLLLATAREDPSAVANLAGKRLVVCSEVGPTARFNEPKVKVLTGGDRLIARFLYGNLFEFTPTHHLWLMGNHQPRVTAGGHSIWRRLRLVPFTHTVPEAAQIKGLGEHLITTEGPAILAWIVKGATAQFGAGLHEPSEVTVATTAYEEEEDHLGRFLEETYEVGGGSGCREVTTDVMNRYRRWCENNGERVMPGQTFGRELRSRFNVDVAKSNGRKLYTNLRLRAPSAEVEDGRPEQMHWSDHD
jgi:putative DNA primase/helicase